MTVSEKAKEIFSKYYAQVQMIDKYSYLTRDEENEFSKQCALIAVEQAILYHPFPNEPDERDVKFKEYWEQVKKEIELL